jgi:hypothetical protein
MRSTTDFENGDTPFSRIGSEVMDFSGDFRAKGIDWRSSLAEMSGDNRMKIHVQTLAPRPG